MSYKIHNSRHFANYIELYSQLGIYELLFKLGVFAVAALVGDENFPAFLVARCSPDVCLVLHKLSHLLAVNPYSRRLLQVADFFPTCGSVLLAVSNGCLMYGFKFS